MAHKQQVGFWAKMLDLIGLTEEVVDEKDIYSKDDFDGHPAHGRSAGKNPHFSDEFDDEPKMSRVQSKRPMAGTTASGKSGFDFDESWEELSSRPDYGARNQQRAQSKSRPTAGRYNSEQRSSNMNGKSSARYEGAQEGDSFYRGASSYQPGDYHPGAQRTSYGAGSRRYDDPSYSAYSDSYSENRYASESKPVDQAGAPRHQTVIFKLHSVDECKGVILALIEKKSVLLNLDELDSMQAQRTLDTMSGATFAIGATLSRASDRTWLITPSTVDVKDNPVDQAGSSYRSRYNY